MTTTIISIDFYNEIIQQSTPVIIEFYATWCPKCAMMETVYQRVSKHFIHKATFYKMDVDCFPSLVFDLGIELYPTFIVYQKGKILGYTSGVLSESTLSDRILNLI